jgi:hypothetical protein
MQECVVDSVLHGFGLQRADEEMILLDAKGWSVF